MLNREIIIPKALHELHGERTSLGSLLLVYLTGLVVGSIALWQMLPLGLPIWKLMLGVLVFFDIGGGVAANFSRSTNQYYQKNASLRPIFLAMHVIHPLVLAWVFQQDVWYLIGVMVYTLGAAFWVNGMKNSERQYPSAAGLSAVGICLALLFEVSFPFLFTIAPLLMLKLILGFSVRRPDIVVP